MAAFAADDENRVVYLGLANFADKCGLETFSDYKGFDRNLILIVISSCFSELLLLCALLRRQNNRDSAQEALDHSPKKHHCLFVEIVDPVNVE